MVEPGQLSWFDLLDGMTMAVDSNFDYAFPADAAQEGMDLLKAIGVDMTTKKGYIEYRIVKDLADPGHLQGITRWDSEASSTETLSVYVDDDKIKRATELMGTSPTGFVGEVILQP